MSPRESLQDLAADYALGLLSAEDAAAFEQELAQSPGLQWVVREYREALALLPLADRSGPTPPTDLRDRVIARISGAGTRPAPDAPPPAAATPDTRVTPVAAPRTRTPAPLWLALAASLAAAVGLGYQWRSAVRAAGGREIALQTALDSVSRQLSARDATLRSIFAPGVELHVLRSTGAPEPGVEVFWNRKQHQALLYAFNLPVAPKGRTYQLWVMQDQKPVPSVTFDVAPDGHVLLDRVPMPTEGGVQAFAVTEEPAGGSPAPTTPVLLLATVPS